MKTGVYFDNGATTFIKPKGVLRAVEKAMKECSSPGRGGYRQAVKAGEIVYECRERAAELFSVGSPENIVFTFNATHGLNIAIKSIIAPGDRVVISGYEHNSVLRPLNEIGADYKVVSSNLLDSSGIIQSFEREITKDTKAVICTHVSNVFGNVLPVEAIGDICRIRNVPLIVDASQSAGILEVNAAKIGAAFIAMPGHKGLYGPQGTGLLICNHEARPLISGGTGSDSAVLSMPDYLPDRLEAGTHNVPGIAGLNEGLKYVMSRGVAEIQECEVELLYSIIEALSGSKGVTLYDINEHKTGVLSFNLVGLDCEAVAEALAEEGIAVRAGLHCAPLAHKTAGTFDTGTVRLSLSDLNTAKDCRIFIQKINKLLT